MDFHSLSRKELQSLCKKNNIPANITNVAMVQALAALHQVEGLDELVNRPVEHDAQGFQEDRVSATPNTHRKTSTRRKAAGGAGGIELENEDTSMAVTPAVPTSRRRATAISTRRKTKPQMPDDEKKSGQGNPTEVPKTPAAVTTMTRAYNTRRSVRLLEKNLSKMSLMDTEDMGGLVKMDVMSEDTSYISQQTEELAETGKWPSKPMVSTAVSEGTDELEVTSQEKNTEDELSSGAENAVAASLQADPHEDLGKVGSWEVELHDSNLKMEECSETFSYSNEVCDESDFDMNKATGKTVHADTNTQGMFVGLEDSRDFTEPENEKCLETKQGEPFEPFEDAPTDVAAFSLSVEMPDDALMEATGQDILGLLPVSSVNKIDNHDGNVSAEVSALSNEESADASMEVTDQDFTASTVVMPDDASMEATGQEIAASFPMPSVGDDSVSLKGSNACNTDNQDGNDSAEISALAVDVSEDVSMEATDQSAAGLLPMSSSMEELVASNTDNLQCNDSTEISDALISLPSCNTNALANNDVIPEESAIPEQEFKISEETSKPKKSPITEVSVVNIDGVMTIAPIHEQKTGNIQVHSIFAGQSKGDSHCPAQSEPQDVSDEAIQEGDKNQTCIMKENPSYSEYHKMSVRGLKKMLRNLNLDGKSNSKSNYMKEVDSRRTALETLPENQM